jgi:hypothetical protein
MVARPKLSFSAAFSSPPDGRNQGRSAGQQLPAPAPAPARVPPDASGSPCGGGGGRRRTPASGHACPDPVGLENKIRQVTDLEPRHQFHNKQNRMRRCGCGADLCPVTAQVCVTSMPGISEVPHKSIAVRSVAGLAWQVPRRACCLCSVSCRRASTGPSADWAGTTAAAGRRFSDMPCRRDNGSIGCGRTQLDVMGRDPKRASR